MESIRINQNQVRWFYKNQNLWPDYDCVDYVHPRHQAAS